VAEQSGPDLGHVTRRSSAVLTGCIMLPSTSFQPRKGGDMACVPGPLDIVLPENAFRSGISWSAQTTHRSYSS
jgi:hypothetical protein